MTDTDPIRICAVVCEQHTGDLPAAFARASAVADIVELRLDCLLDASPAQLKELCLAVLEHVAKPLIVTLRSATEGGRQEMARSQRLDFWRTMVGHLMSATELFVDIESDLISDLMKEADFCASVDWQRVICSCHDFTGMPEDLNSVYDRLTATPARILKIATLADDVTDCIPMFQLLARARREGRAMIPIAMGSPGLATRVLGPSRGAFLTYGSIAAEQPVAPGQVTAKELVELYRVRQLNSQTQVFGLIGNPVGHSISPQIHNAAFSFTGRDAAFLPFHVRDAGEFMRRLVKIQSREIDWNLCGLSVTAPHKSAVMPHLDWIDPAAKEIGAVNTIVIEADALRGYNTDAAAFIGPLRSALSPLSSLSCAVIGAGGAARTAIWSLLKEGAAVSLLVRNPATAAPIATAFGLDCIQLQGASLRDFDVVVNATPLGTAGERQLETPAVAEQLGGVRLVYDLVYNPRETVLLKEAARAGCQGIGGLEMLLTQAAAQFKLWTGADAPLEVMRAAAKRALSEPPAGAGG